MDTFLKESWLLTLVPSLYKILSQHSTHNVITFYISISLILLLAPRGHKVHLIFAFPVPGMSQMFNKCLLNEWIKEVTIHSDIWYIRNKEEGKFTTSILETWKSSRKMNRNEKIKRHGGQEFSLRRLKKRMDLVFHRLNCICTRRWLEKQDQKINESSRLRL